jgi:hypothetical protein
MRAPLPRGCALAQIRERQPAVAFAPTMMRRRQAAMPLAPAKA